MDNVWTVARHCDDTGKSNDDIVKELLDFCVYNSIQLERERLVAHSIQTWRMFHRHEAKAGFWCDICKQCFRKRKAIICVSCHEATKVELPCSLVALGIQ